MDCELGLWGESAQETGLSSSLLLIHLDATLIAAVARLITLIEKTGQRRDDLKSE